jgi:glycosyltransferase involved in cell wall biosynthesis
MISSISIVIPAYNEERRIGATIDAVRAYLAHRRRSGEILVIDDGSTDATACIAKTHGATVIRNDVNRGKGYSIRAGLDAAAGDFVLLCDADLSTPIEHADALLEALEAGSGIAIASRPIPTPPFVFVSLARRIDRILTSGACRASHGRKRYHCSFKPCANRTEIACGRG